MKRFPASLKVLYVSSVTTALAFSAIGTAAQAQSEGGIEEIVVTAQKKEQNLNDVGMSISAVSGTQLANLGIKDSEGLTKLVPGFVYTRGSYGAPVYTLRGVGFFSLVSNAAPAVSVYVDETPVPYSAMTRGVALDVERVEVLKGPQGTLFGQNATGGAINYIANKPTDYLTTGLDVSANNFGQVTVGGFASGPLADNLRARIAASIDQGGAWQKSYTRNDKLGDTRFYNGRLLVDWDPASNLSLSFSASGWIDHSDEQAGQPLQLVTNGRTPQALIDAFEQYPDLTSARWADWDPGQPLGTNDPLGNAVHDAYKRDNNFYQLSTRADYKLGDVTLTSITAWQNLNISTFIDTDSLNVANYHITTIAEIRSFSQELRLAGQIGRLQWIVGANYSNDRFYNYGGIFTGAGLGTFPFRTAGSLANSQMKTYAGFANLEYELSDAVTLLAGIRYTEVKIDNAGCTLDGGDGAFAAYVVGVAANNGVTIAAPAAGSCITMDPTTFQTGLVLDSLDESNVPFKVGVNWKFGGNQLLYANISRGYKAGSYTPGGAIFAPSLDPAVQESVFAYEAGFKLSLADRHVQLNGAAFYYDYKNKQVQGKLTQEGVGTLNKLINIPKSQISGAELQLTWVPDDSWVFNLGGSYVASKIGDNFTNYTIGGVLMNMDGQSIPFTPEWQFSGDAEYSTPVSDNVRLFIGGNVKYQSKSYSGLGEEEPFRIDGYANLDLRLGARDEEGKWSVTAFANNVTDKYSWTFVGFGPDMISRLANRPRTVGLRVSIKH